MKKSYNFAVSITSRHDSYTEAFKVSIESQLQKLARFHPHIVDANVILDRRNSIYKVEITLRVPGTVITATHEDYIQIKALDSALDKAKIQLKKLKSKVVDHRITTLDTFTEAEESEEIDTMK